MKSSKSSKSQRASAVLLGSAPDRDAALAVDTLLAEDRERYAERVFNAAVSQAIKDDSFRKRLAAKLRDLGEGAPRRAVGSFELQQVATVATLIRLNYAGTRKSFVSRKPRLFDEIALFLGITPGQAKSRYYAAKARGLDL